MALQAVSSCDSLKYKRLEFFSLTLIFPLQVTTPANHLEDKLVAFLATHLHFVTEQSSMADILAQQIQHLLIAKEAWQMENVNT